MRDWIRLAFPVIYKGLNVLTKYYGKINKYNKPTTQNSSVTNKAPFQKKKTNKITRTFVLQIRFERK